MRVANKELLPQSTNDVARPSVLITVKRYMPRGRRYSVSTWTGWPMDNRMCYVTGTSKAEALFVANKLAAKYF